MDEPTLNDQPAHRDDGMESHATAEERRAPLTPRQKQVLDFIGAYLVSKGYAPTLEEIGREMGLSALATVHKHLENLREKGYIRRAWNRNRSIEMVWQSDCCPACWRPLLTGEAK